MTSPEEHPAACSCGQLSLVATGDPVRVSVCHCLACQQRTGSAFGVQARFDADRVEVRGRSTAYTRFADDDGEAREFHFCPVCGATVFYTYPPDPSVVAVPVGAFADPAFPAPVRAIYEDRAHPWIEVRDISVHD